MFVWHTAESSKSSVGLAWTAAAASLTATAFASQSPALCLWGATPAATKEDSLIKESDELYKKGDYANLKVHTREATVREHMGEMARILQGIPAVFVVKNLGSSNLTKDAPQEHLEARAAESDNVQLLWRFARLTVFPPLSLPLSKEFPLLPRCPCDPWSHGKQQVSNRGSQV